MKLSHTSALLLSFALIAGCNKKANTPPNFANAINAYSEAHPACLWAEGKKFPVQAATSDDEKTQGYDALVDQGLLVRTTSEKKIIIISRQENNYDLSATGRSAWIADPNQPGYGNFCYGHRTVSSIDSSSPTSDQPGATTTVTYHYAMTAVPTWASAAETQTAFPRVRANLEGVAAATLTNTTNGWQVTSRDATPADGKVVQ